MATGDLTTTADVKAWIGRTDSTSDAVIARLITDASAFIAMFTDRDNLGQVKAYSEIRDGHGNTNLFLAEGPATSITSLAIDTVSIPAQPADGQPGYFLTSGGRVLSLYGYAYSRGSRNVRVSYQAGYSTPPYDIAQACIEIVAQQLARGKRVDEESQALPGGQTIRFSQRDIPPGAKSILQRWSRVVTA